MTALSAFRPASHRVLPLPIRLLRLAGVVMLLATGLLQAAGKDLPFGEAADPLPPEVAFVPTLSASARDELLVEFTIAPKYYLYRDRIEITTAGGETASLGKADLPTGLKIEDDFFGESWIYRDSVRISVPVTVPPGQNSLALEVVFQGCADMGLCYPPLTQAHEVALPAGPTVAALGADEPADSPAGRFTAQPADQSAAQLAAQSSALPTGKGPGNLRELLDETDTTSDSDELLPPREAFVPRLGPSRTDTLALSWQIEPGYYLYKDKLQFTLEGADGATISAAIGAIDLPDGEQQHDDFFGTTEVYRDATDIQLAVDPPATVRDAELVISYQGCADIGVCFPPDTLRVPVTFNAAAALLPASTTDGFAAERVSEQDRLSGQLASASLWLNALTFFGLGLLLAFTPCVLPMIPILSSLIVGQGERLSTGHAFRLSLVYVLAMALTYTTLGVLVGLSGYNLQAWFQDPWILSAFAALFVLLSLSMFGLYELQVPLAVQNRLAAWSNRQQGGRLGGVAIMGFLSALIVGPCVTAPLVGALVYIAETGDAVIGGVALFSLSMGMGVPLLLVGTSAGRLMPSAGAWMVKTKAVFGVILLAMAIWMLSRFLPAGVILALSAILLVLSGIYFGATDGLDQHSSGAQRLGKGVGLVVSLYGAALMIGALSGGHSFLTPLQGIASGGGESAESDELVFQRIKRLDELQNIVAGASADGRPVLLDFYADWCVSCKEMEAFTFTDPGVQARLDDAVVLQADVTANDADDQALLKHFGLFGPPAIILYDAAGAEQRAGRVVGFMPAERFREHLASFIGT